METPYEVDPSNPRRVLNMERSNKVYLGAAIIFLASMRLYSRKMFRFDNNGANFGMFTIASVWCSYQYSSFFLSSPVIEAGMINNANEE